MPTSKDEMSAHDNSQCNISRTDSRLLSLELCIDLLQSLYEDAQTEFTSLAGDIVALDSEVGALQNGLIKQEQASMSAHMNAILTKMQFSDRFCQRLDNTRQSLACLQDVMLANPNSLRETEGLSLRDQTRSIFTTEQERTRFDQVFDVVKQTASSEPAPSSSNNNILLFEDGEQSHE